MLEVEDLRVSYGPVQAVRGVTLRVAPGEVVGLIGANGAGKTTTLKAILGLVPTLGGQISWDGRALDRLTTPARIRAGLALVPQGRELFGGFTVAENLRAGSWLAPALPDSGGGRLGPSRRSAARFSGAGRQARAAGGDTVRR